MATKTSNSFIDSLGKIYGIYAGGFIGFVIILAILEQMGVPNKVIGYCFVFLTIGVYAYIGIISRTAEISEYYVAGRVVPPFFNGMATGADWMSAASFISMAGGLYSNLNTVMLNMINGNPLAATFSNVTVTNQNGVPPISSTPVGTAALGLRTRARTWCPRSTACASSSLGTET